MPLNAVNVGSLLNSTLSPLGNWALAHGPAYQHPRRVFLVPELPLAGTNKIDRAALKARALAAPPNPPPGG